MLVMDESAPLGSASIVSDVWSLPFVDVVCKCGHPFAAPDLRRESEKRQRAKCPSCGALLNGKYREVLRELDELEAVRLPDGRLVFCKLQLFMLEASSFLRTSGSFQSAMLVGSGVFGAKSGVKACLKLGLIEPSDNGRLLYRFTEVGKLVHEAAARRYGMQRRASEAPRPLLRQP